ncbi:cytochrome P450 9e2-like [Euwallacea fornicatus]|uniref:cytochrome P450 9e2-like n=1 Tax=Euwallacea fornicatus TaxID=995702 RepID=UPI00338DED40
MWTILTLILLIILWYLLINPLCHWKRLGVFQTKSPWMILGDSWRKMSFIRGPSAFFDFVKWCTEGCRATGYMGIYDFAIPVLCITDPELIKTITVKDFEYFTDVMPLNINSELDCLLAGNLLFLNGKKWKSTRSMVSPILTSKKLKFLWQFIADETTDLVDYLLEKTFDVGYIEIEMVDLFLRYVSDVTTNIAVGIKIDSLRDKNNAIYKSALAFANVNLEGLSSLMLKFFPKLSKLLGIRILDQKLILPLMEAYKEAVRLKINNQVRRNDVVDSLLDIISEENTDEESLSTTNMTFWDVVGVAADFFLAGLNSMSSVLSFGAYELAFNKDVQDKLRLEINKCVQNHDEITREVIQDMEYMDMVVSELLRKWPPSLATDRVVVKPYNLKLGENTVKLDIKQRITIPIFGLHRMPEHFPNPDKFDPERFSSENRTKINPYTYIPFGKGPRVCLGIRLALMNIKLVLFHLLRNFELMPSTRTLSSIKIKATLTQYQIGEGCWITMKRIETTCCDTERCTHL